MINLVKEGVRYYLRCRRCNATGPSEQTAAAARHSWNRAGDGLAAERSRIATAARVRARQHRRLTDGKDCGDAMAVAMDAFAEWVLAGGPGKA